MLREEIVKGRGKKSIEDEIGDVKFEGAIVADPRNVGTLGITNESSLGYFNLYPDYIIPRDFYVSATPSNYRKTHLDLYLSGVKNKKYGMKNIRPEYIFDDVIITTTKKKYSNILELQNKNGRIYDYDDSSLYSEHNLYSRTYFALNHIKSNVHIVLKDNQKVFMIYENLVFKITGNNNIQFHCESGDLNILSYEDSIFTDIIYGFRSTFGFGSGLIYGTNIAIIEYSQYKLLRKSTKELFPSVENFKYTRSSNPNLINTITDYISCIYREDILNTLYLYVNTKYKSDLFEKKEELLTIDSLRDMFSSVYSGEDTKLMKKDNISKGYKFKSKDKIIESVLHPRLNLSQIIESKNKKPIYSKKRRG